MDKQAPVRDRIQNLLAGAFYVLLFVFPMFTAVYNGWQNLCNGGFQHKVKLTLFLMIAAIPVCRGSLPFRTVQG